MIEKLNKLSSLIQEIGNEIMEKPVQTETEKKFLLSTVFLINNIIELRILNEITNN